MRICRKKCICMFCIALFIRLPEVPSRSVIPNLVERNDLLVCEAESRAAFHFSSSISELLRKFNKGLRYKHCLDLILFPTEFLLLGSQNIQPGAIVSKIFAPSLAGKLTRIQTFSVPRLLRLDGWSRANRVIYLRNILTKGAESHLKREIREFP